MHADNDERAQLEALSKDELLDVFEDGLFELITEGKKYPELMEMTLALGIRAFVRERLAGRPQAELVELFMDSEAAVVAMVDYASDTGLLDE